MTNPFLAVHRPLRLATSALALMAGLGFTACNNDDGGSDPPAPQTITEVVLSNPDFTLLRAAVQRAGLAETLGAGTLTVFAPNDAAFRAAGFADVAAINAVPDSTLRGILRYHVLNTRTASTEFPTADNTQLSSLANSALFVTRNAGGVSVNGAQVTQADLPASNGVIHIVNQVLMPPMGNLVRLAQGNPDLSLLVAAIDRASDSPTDVAEVLAGTGPFTVFAPTNAAFQAAGFADVAAINAAVPDSLARILTYHVVQARAFSTNLTAGNLATAQGGNLTVTVSPISIRGRGNGTSAANVTRPNQVASNGVVHVIDRVLLP
jgi:uncharacterized surface protein with fasciclin (FAS1) repeats